jgi:hypothetical protein
VQNGVLFLWAYLKSYRSYLRKRTIGKRYQKVHQLNQSNDKNQILSVMNSYLWIAQHHHSYKLSRKMWKQCNNRIWSAFSLTANAKKIKPIIRKLKSKEVKALRPEGFRKGSLW